MRGFMHDRRRDPGDGGGGIVQKSLVEDARLQRALMVSKTME